jgi:hypothetical protein
MSRLRIAFALPAALALPCLALACGICVEDQIAATYDHAVVALAESSGRRVLFTAVRGENAGAPGSGAKIRRAISSVTGVDRDSIRVSLLPPAASFSWNPRSLDTRAVLRAINDRLAGTGLTLAALRTFGDHDIERLKRVAKKSARA